jgi:release factor glutamine methyltransferase
VIAELKSGRPVQYVLGRAEFCELEFEVAEGVLIPRPETEELVRWIESDYRHCEGARVVDLGTGSGAIAIALANRLSGSRVTAFDISDDALAIARRNGATHAPQVEFLKGDMLALDPIEGLDIVVSNPPYVPQSDLASMHRNVKEWEPHTALFVPDEHPLMFYEAVVDFAVRSLKKGGRLYCEIYEHLAEQTVEMAAQRGLPDGEIRCDIMDRPRMIRWTKA